MEPADATGAVPGPPPTDPDDPRPGAETTGASDVDVEARWQAAQGRFIDAPGEAVVAADELVRDVITAITARLDRDRAEVAELWRDDGDTEMLRTVMLRYRELLDRLSNRTI